MKKEAPDWLKRTQEASWEPEILISGISLIALFQLPELIIRANIFVEDNTFAMFLFGTADNAFFTLLETAVYWLITCLIAHLGLRSIWVSFVGLSYSFPNGIAFTNLKLGSYFKSRLLRIPTFEESVIRLEKISSMMYATAFMLVLATIGIAFYLIFWAFILVVIFSFLPAVIKNAIDIDSVFGLIILLTGVPYFIDFITLGWLKRFDFYSRIYKPIYRLMGILTLAPFYRGIYYGLISNIKRRYIFSGVILFILITLFLIVSLRSGSLLNRSELMSNSVGYTVYDGFYRDLKSETPSRYATIGSSEVEKGVINLIISHKAAYEDFIKSECEYDERLATGDELKNLIMLDCLSSIFQIELDSVPIIPERWFFADSPGSNQKGIATWIRTDTITNGVHQLNVYINDGQKDKRMWASIPFFNLSGRSFSKSKTIELPGTQNKERDSIPTINLPIKQDL